MRLTPFGYHSRIELEPKTKSNRDYHSWLQRYGVDILLHQPHCLLWWLPIRWLLTKNISRYCWGGKHYLGSFIQALSCLEAFLLTDSPQLTSHPSNRAQWVRASLVLSLLAPLISPQAYGRNWINHSSFRACYDDPKGWLWQFCKIPCYNLKKLLIIFAAENSTSIWYVMKTVSYCNHCWSNDSDLSLESLRRNLYRGGITDGTLAVSVTRSLSPWNYKS